MSKKILISSIPSWNQATGSNTLSCLFDAFERDQLANIYVCGDVPDSTVCSRYFHIDEMAVVKSVLLRNIKTGEEVHVTKSVNLPKANGRKKQMKRTRFKLWMREIAWKLGCWKSKDLNKFLDDIKPEILVFPIESYPYFNRLNKYIINYCKPEKVVGYLWDDNFTYKQHPYSVIAKIERFFLRRQVKTLIDSCTDVLAISPKMKEECDAEFGTNSIILTKPIFNQGPFKNFSINKPIRILYTGKLIIGREYTIVEIVNAIKRINADEQKVILDVYTNTVLPTDLKSQIDVQGCCVLHDPVPQSEVATLQKNADILLFAESLSDQDLTARLSFSTKLTDYFAAGKCVWAVGNSDLGPIAYVKDENAGFVSTDSNEVDFVLKHLVEYPKSIIEMAKNGYDCGRRNHDGNQIVKKLKRIIYAE